MRNLICLDCAIIHSIEIIKRRSALISKSRNSWSSAFLSPYKFGTQLDKNALNVSPVKCFRFEQFEERIWKLIFSCLLSWCSCDCWCFWFDNLETLKSAENWISEALNVTSSDDPIVFLVGSKRDLIVGELWSIYSLSTGRSRVCFVWRKIEQTVRLTAKRLNAEYWPVSSLTGYQVQELFKRIACISYQLLIKQQLDPQEHSSEKKSTKTQLAVNLNTVYRENMKSKDNCCWNKNRNQ